MPPSPLDRYRSDGLESMSSQRLLVLLYERLALDLDRASAALAADRRPADAHDALVHAQDIVASLRLALDEGAWSGATTLDAIYGHLEDLLVEANVAKSAQLVGQCQRLVLPLLDAWREAYRTVSAERVGAADGRVLA
jgi:flagellar secretion chaperone FliS